MQQWDALSWCSTEYATGHYSAEPPEHAADPGTRRDERGFSIPGDSVRGCSDRIQYYSCDLSKHELSTTHFSIWCQCRLFITEWFFWTSSRLNFNFIEKGVYGRQLVMLRYPFVPQVQVTQLFPMIFLGFSVYSIDEDLWSMSDRYCFDIIHQYH